MDDDDDVLSNEDISKGVALLDEKRPGWEKEIDVDELAMGSTCRCVVGQLFGDYYDGLDALVESARFAEEIELGFATAHGRWAELTQAWRDEIVARRQAIRA